ncbi:MAG: hypothetical protein QOJ92_2339 [Frankiales bacterium]|nr:hypothetical protein [Frankiales bacterium]MDX6275129.1 hypothetical protein [Frankiales bacterium]
MAGLEQRKPPDFYVRTALWGDSKRLVQLKCGVPRPPELNEASTLLDVDAVTWFAVPEGPRTRYWAVDRRPYVVVLVPTSISADQVLVPVGKALATLPKSPVVTATG